MKSLNRAQYWETKLQDTTKFTQYRLWKKSKSWDRKTRPNTWRSASWLAVSSNISWYKGMKNKIQNSQSNKSIKLISFKSIDWHFPCIFIALTDISKD
jgi:hypothetical protein